MTRPRLRSFQAFETTDATKSEAENLLLIYSYKILNCSYEKMYSAAHFSSYSRAV